MDRAIYIGLSGATEAMAAQTVHANNLANVSTTGFRADLVQAQAVQVEGAGMETRFANQLLAETGASCLRTPFSRPAGGAVETVLQAQTERAAQPARKLTASDRIVIVDLEQDTAFL